MRKSVKRNVEAGGSGRWSAKRKADAVMKLLKGEDLDTLSRQLKVTASTLSEWRDIFLANGIAGLKSREVDGRDERIASRVRRSCARPRAMAAPSGSSAR